MKFDSIKKISFSKIIFWLLFISMLYSVFSLKRWSMAETNAKIINWDVTSYYSYLPAAFIYHDITFEFISKFPEKKFGEKHEFFYQTAPNGGKVAKFTMGTAFLYAPFFYIAHASAHIFNYEANGFSIPYEFCLALSSLFYLFIGLYFLRKMLLLFFNEKSTALTLISVLLGTNLYYYTTNEPAMSHVYSFSLVSAFMFHFITWYNFPTFKKAIYIGLLFGMIVLIRPVNIVILAFPLFYGVYNKETFFSKLHFILKHWKQLAIIGLSCFVVFVPQLIYWKYITGSWLFYSYLNETFYFAHPHILKGLLSYRNGWFIYTPLMFIAFTGLFSLSKKNKTLMLPVFIFFFINIYVAYSWWTWWYGGSFGSRPMIDTYAIMALPMAALFQQLIGKSKVIAIVFVTIIAALITLNLFQSYQKRKGIIHHDAMSKEAYWYVFFKSELTGADCTFLDKAFVHPDYDKAILGKEE